MSEIKSGTVRVGKLDIAYDVRGAGAPILLIPGFAMSRLMWSDALSEKLVAQGLTVVRIDNRDSGESSRVDERPPKLRTSMLRSLFGLSVAAPYLLSDMARDAAAVMSELGFERFHVAGASMGGMIAQTLAIEYPQRVLSLTSIMSTPGGRRHSFADPRALIAITRPAPTEPVALLAHLMGVMKLLNGAQLPFEDAEVQAFLVAQSPTRPSPIAALRQFTAIVVSGNRRAGLRKVRVPTLVLHGTHDPLLPVRGSRAIARLVPGARFVALAGMGHYFHSSKLDEIARNIGAVVRAAG